MSCRITGLLGRGRFGLPLFDLSDEALAARGAVRQIADGRRPGYPCRISLTDSAPGDELILVNYEHHPVSSPYRMRFAVYVRRGEETFDRIDEIPEQLRIRTLAVRAFDRNAMTAGNWSRGARAGGGDRPPLRQLRVRAAYLHLHYAAPGCYGRQRVGRVQDRALLILHDPQSRRRMPGSEFMRLGEILVGGGFVGVADVAAAIARQKVEGGRLGENLIALGLLQQPTISAKVLGGDANPAGDGCRYRHPSPQPAQSAAQADAHWNRSRPCRS